METLKEEYSGILEIGDMKIECAVLSNGVRVLSYRGVNRLLGQSEKWNVTGATKTPPFLAKKALEHFIHKDLSVPLSEPIIYRPKHGGRTAYGVPAITLPLICEVWLKAREAGVLTSLKDRMTASKSEIVMRGLAHIGIIALVDEATGYQETRDRQELQKILKAYIAKELLPWTLKFPEEFYKEMFRLNNWSYGATSKQKKPMLAGKYTKQYIYDQLPEGVIDEIKKLNPKRITGSAKGLHEKHHHRYLTKEVGHPHLDKLIASVTTLMRISPNWRKFQEHFARAFGKQAQLDFPDKEDTI